eukprot:SAG22_NODE_2053_length_3072_cov_3.721157_2_plen_243_part_00
MYYGGGNLTQKNPGSQPLTSDFVSLALKGRTDGFDLKGGDATQGKLVTQYSGPRPDRTIAGTCGGGGQPGVALEKCAAGNTAQIWGFKKESARSKKHQIANGDLCLDIGGYGTHKGSNVGVYPCDNAQVKQNEDWGLEANGSIPSLQPDTPHCLGAKGTKVGSGLVLDDCGAPTATFKVGFTSTSGTGTIVQKASGLCLTVTPPPPPPPTVQSYQPMRKKGAIILATGGDNSNSAKGNFCEC